MLHAVIALALGWGTGGLAPAKVALIGPYFTVDAKINGQAARLTVDTGAGMNVLTPKAADRLGLKGGVPVTARGVGSEGVPARIVTLESFVVEGTPNAKPQAVVIPLPEILQTDGLVGHGFLSAYIARFDYAGGQLDFIAPGEFRPPAGLVETPLRVRGNIPEIQMTIEGVEGWVKLDTGANENLALFKSFIDAQKLREKLPNIRPSFGGRDVGGAAPADQTTLRGMRLAGFDLPPMTVSLSKQTAGAFADAGAIANLGAGILRRFVFVLDYRAGKAYFQKSRLFDEPERRDRFGAFLDFDASGHRVLAVREGSPAAALKISPGDRLLAMNGRPVDSEPALAIWEKLRQPAGTKVSLRLRSAGGEERTVEAVLADF